MSQIFIDLGIPKPSEESDFARLGIRLSVSLLDTQLARQKEDLRNFRNQAAFCAAINTLIASIFSSFLSQLDWKVSYIGSFLSLPVSLWFVLFLISGSLIHTILIIIAFEKGTFDLNTDYILHQVKGKKGLEETLQHLAENGSLFFDANEVIIGRTRSRLVYALLFAFAQIPAWLFYIVSAI
ncbi:hypothetical protein [Roseinatronobacter monicus]|uniref:hypothetical protein n=1 Tax=Roseinatronobacter monicus TaxID=393481 RepID=UPI00114FF308|nr:hypothetical protein [Roseinatronobacter monicus]